MRQYTVHYSNVRKSLVQNTINNICHDDLDQTSKPQMDHDDKHIVNLEAEMNDALGHDYALVSWLYWEVDNLG